MALGTPLLFQWNTNIILDIDYIVVNGFYPEDHDNKNREFSCPVDAADLISQPLNDFQLFLGEVRPP